jgi:dTDP-4-amino-4,6-dideoxygalactose transaminase
LSENPEDLISKFDSAGIDARVHYPIACNKHNVYSNHLQHKESLPICDDVANRLVAIPVHPSLSDECIERINSVLNL